MKHTERLQAIADELSLPVKSVNDVFVAMTTLYRYRASKNRSSTIQGFVTFEIRAVASRRYWDERAGKMKSGRARKKVRAYLTPSLKLRLKNRGFAP